MNEMKWEEFRDSALFWWVNRMLHTLGVALVFAENEDGSIARVFPARVGYRGFPAEVEEEKFKQLTAFIAKEAPRLIWDVQG